MPSLSTMNNGNAMRIPVQLIHFASLAHSRGEQLIYSQINEFEPEKTSSSRLKLFFKALKEMATMTIARK